MNSPYKSTSTGGPVDRARHVPRATGQVRAKAKHCDTPNTASRSQLVAHTAAQQRERERDSKKVNHNTVIVRTMRSVRRCRCPFRLRTTMRHAARGGLFHAHPQTTRNPPQPAKLVACLCVYCSRALLLCTSIRDNMPDLSARTHAPIPPQHPPPPNTDECVMVAGRTKHPTCVRASVPIALMVLSPQNCADCKSFCKFDYMCLIMPSRTFCDCANTFYNSAQTFVGSELYSDAKARSRICDDVRRT